MRHPRAIVTVGRLAFLIGPDLGERIGVGRLIVLHRNLRGHPAYGVDVAPVTGLDA